MKQKLFNLLPSWIKSLKHADKFAHAIYGTLFYLLLLLFMDKGLALFSTILLAGLVEISDKYNDGTTDIKDFFATILIPIIIFIC